MGAGARRDGRLAAGGLTTRFLALVVLSALVGACAALPPPTRPAPVVTGKEERGLASWYGDRHHGRPTASGEIYDMHAMTAAHRTLPFGTWLLVENLDTGRSARVRVNDRGPFVDGRILDVSRAAAVALGALDRGVFRARLRVAPP